MPRGTFRSTGSCKRDFYLWHFNRTHQFLGDLGKEQDKLKDHELIERFLRSQDPALFQTLYRRYAGKVYAKCISMLQDRGLAQDAVQEIFTRLFLNLHKFNGKARFSTWLYAITYNYCIDCLRRRHKEQAIFSDEMEQSEDEAALQQEDLPDKVLLEMELDRLEAVLDAIPPGDKAVLLMKYQDGMQIREIAEAIDKTESAIKMQLKRAKAKARQAYKRLFGHDPLR